MSDLPPSTPYPPYDPAGEGYGQVPADATVKKLIMLAFIFDFVMAGIDAVYGIGMIVAAFVVPAIITASAAAGPAGASPPPPTAVLVVIYCGMGLVSLLAGIVKLIAGLKMKRNSRGAWGWGLAAGIVACVQLWCSFFCVLPMAAGIYSIVILCREDVRSYFARGNETAI